MKKMVLLNAYGLSQEAEKEPHVEAFVNAVRERLHDVSFEIHYSRSLKKHAEWFAKRLQDPLDLVYACGSTLMEIASNALQTQDHQRPILLYWGSHIDEESGLLNPRSGYELTCGVELSMPLYSSFRQFRLLKTFFPYLQNVYTVFALDGAFARGRVQESYRAAMLSDGQSCWIDASSPLVGHPQLGRLAEAFDLKLYEHPCLNGEDAYAAISRIPSEATERLEDARSVLVACADCFHAPGCVESLIYASHEYRIPFVGQGICGFLNDFGPLILVENSFARAAAYSGELAAGLLKERDPRATQFKRDFYQVRLNTSYANKGGFTLAGRKLELTRREITYVLDEENRAII